MSFVRTLASAGTFGLTGLAASALTKKNNDKTAKPQPSMINGYNATPTPSLMNSNGN